MTQPSLLHSNERYKRLKETDKYPLTTLTTKYMFLGIQTQPLLIVIHRPLKNCSPRSLDVTLPHFINSKRVLRDLVVCESQLIEFIKYLPCMNPELRFTMYNVCCRLPQRNIHKAEHVFISVTASFPHRYPVYWDVMWAALLSIFFIVYQPVICIGEE